MDVVDEYKDVVLNPKHGYGAHLNPCLDCKVFMVNKALVADVLEQGGFDFVLTGEVVGQRPMSQRADTMPIIASESGAGERLLRPLTAHNLPPTLPERLGWVDRAKLHGFRGRNRKPQMALARQYGFSDYAQPAGGCCFLTDARYAGKLRDLWRARGERITRSTTSCCSKWVAISDPRRITSSSSGAKKARTAFWPATAGASRICEPSATRGR